MKLQLWWQELGLAARALRRRPGHSALVVLVLSAGLGCVLFMLSLVNGLVLRPMPFPAQEELLMLGLNDPGNLEDLGAVPAMDLLTLEPLLDAEYAHAAHQDATINLSDTGRPERFNGEVVRGDLFGVLGVPPALGRGFTRSDQQAGAPLVVVLSDRLWRSRYLADPAIIGRQVRANAQVATVVGVMPPGFSYPYRQDIWMPSRQDPAHPDPDQDFEVLVRAAPDQQAALRARFDAWFADRQRADPARLRPFATQMFDIGRRFISDETRGLLSSMLIAVLLVLLVACANAANLLLGRAWSERQRLALQAAIGAGRSRLLLQPLLQSLLLSLTAGLLALLCAQTCAHWLMRELTNGDDGAPQWFRVDIDGAMALATVGVALLTGLVAGVLPAWRASRVNLSDALRERSGSASRAMARLTQGLVVAELTLSLVVLLAAAVLVRGMREMVGADLGLKQTSELLTARIALFPEQYPDAAAQLGLYERLAATLRQDAQVIDASVASVLPGLISGHDLVAIDGQPEPDTGFRTVEVGSVDTHFLSTYGLQLAAGRAFDSSDVAGGLPVAVVDQQFVETHFPDGQALGKRIRMVPQDPASPWLQVVGVLERLHLDDLDDPQVPSVLLPLAQQPLRFVSLAVRVRGEPLAYIPRLQAVMRTIDPDTPLYWVRDYDEVSRQATFGVMIVARMFTAFAVVALLLAAIGLYGVLAWTVVQRTRELGVRRALGAPGFTLVQALGRSAMTQVLLGAGLGLSLGVQFANLLATQLPGMRAVDMYLALPVLLVLLVAAVLAVLLPARRALRVDPMVALRSD